MNKKRILVFAIPILLLLGLGSAALVGYFSNTVTAEVTVESPMSIEIEGYEENVVDVNLYGGESFELHTITTNLANVPIVDILVEISVVDFDGVGITYHHSDGSWEGDIPACTFEGSAYYYVGPAGGFTAEVGYNLEATSTITTAQDLSPGTYTAVVKIIPASERVC